MPTQHGDVDVRAAMLRSDDRLDAIADLAAFLIGAPRSGTTWLQSLLGAHPAIVTPQETGVFHRFLAPWSDEFDRKVDLARQAGREERVVGLPVVLTRERFDGVLRHVLDVVGDAATELKPGARVVLEKTPENARHVPLIKRLVPDARFIHIVRDGRDVAASLLAASDSWGGRWAPADIRSAAAMWRDHVLGARSAAGDDRYIEVSYDDLLTDGPAQLVRILAHCGASATLEEATEICERFAFERVSTTPTRTYEAVLIGGEAARQTDDVTREPDGFFRVGTSGSWRAWGPRQCWAFDDIAGDLLVELGFEASRDWCVPSARSRSVRAVASRAGRAKRRTRRTAGSVIRRALAATSNQ